VRRHLLENNAPPEWNVRVFTEADFWDECRRLRISVREVQLEQPAYSIVRVVNPRIYVHDELRGVEKLYVCLHELGHHLMHRAGIQFFLGCKDRIELEAEVFAVCALIPQTILPPRFAWSEIRDLYGYPDWMMNRRLAVFKKWGF